MLVKRKVRRKKLTRNDVIYIMWMLINFLEERSMDRNTNFDKTMNTIIGRGAVSEGHFQIAAGVRVDGILKGELESSGTLIVGKSGVIEANVKVRDALISGRIVGNLVAEEKVHLQSQATFIGKIQTGVLIVEDGAVFKADCDAGSDIQGVDRLSDETAEVQREEA
ncbi:MAG: polymer-forming cytoskeletal protein [Gemmatimonadetes bacterium]|nr:polymer-forming cytoskeletal protein [Gemmatimonadota bacterium]MYF72509.1 polymer-forming cytoskeletal protein [Gemmatimonadota bacterium]MYK50178.1 polymer-forming cytoskeletal protein [Gemmatimonadota bacterium]